MEAGTGSGGHHPKVVGNFGQVHRTGFHSGRGGHKAVQILSGIDQVFGLAQIQPGDGGQVGNNGADITFIRIDAGADSSAAHIDVHELVRDMGHTPQIPLYHGTVGAKFLTQTDRNCILHLGAFPFSAVRQSAGSTGSWLPAEA